MYDKSTIQLASVGLAQACPNNIHSLQSLKHTYYFHLVYKHITALPWIQLLSAHKQTFGFKCGSFCIVLRCSQIVPVHTESLDRGSETEVQLGMT